MSSELFKYSEDFKTSSDFQKSKKPQKLQQNFGSNFSWLFDKFPKGLIQTMS